ncbi:chloride channel protein [Parahaliea mediterranea]|uniref:Chloride channel protein n=1 Tax=Parahaliea mediterranea TaxID=651086 RepID=A0A939DKE6_9GAMM|nr:chloride channel protein [Parahaliea mediterranea]MBN7799117.1 chloride channel protein [Parahaliea mediterranea]
MYRLLNTYRRYLTNYHSVLAYAVLGVVGGVASGLTVLAFETAIAELARLWGVGGGGEAFEALPRWQLFALPTLGALALGLGFSLLKPENRETGIVHVISRMHSDYGVLPLRNALVQFIGGAFALATGQSGGREGPGVHLGGAINSLLGQHLGLPNNSLRVLIACGTAGGIAAAFNTPLAGVIFAMEVIVAEYTVAGFIPVMLSAVSASAIARNLGGGAVLFSIPAVELNSLWELPYIVLLGICCGVAVTAFIQLSRLSTRLSHWPVALRFTLAGALTGALALLVPQTLGIGYDTLNLALQGELLLPLLLAIAASKLLATGVSCGVGMPIGLIGPNLLIGACLGGVLGLVGQGYAPELASEITLYIALGMAACMGAVLNAPLAAILAVIELTQSASVAMPALLAIIAANLTNNGVFRQRAAHQTVLRQLRRVVPDDPLNQLLHRTDVTSNMEVSVIKIPIELERSSIPALINATPAWCLVTREGEDLFLLRGQELAQWLGQHVPEEGPINLSEADLRRWSIAPVPVQATLRQAMDRLKERTAEAVCVYGRSASGNRVLQGIVTRESIERFSLANL